MGREGEAAIGGSREGDANIGGGGGGGEGEGRRGTGCRRHHHLSSVSKTKFVPTRVLHATFFTVSTPSSRFSFPRSLEQEERLRSFSRGEE